MRAEPPSANFVAFAAQRPLKAVEIPIAEDGGKTHGAFTWALIEGLRGAAADVNGSVTGRSLADWVRNAQASQNDPRDLADVDVAKEPEVIQEDARLIFARGVSKPSYPMRVTFPVGARRHRAALVRRTAPGRTGVPCRRRPRQVRRCSRASIWSTSPMPGFGRVSRSCARWTSRSRTTGLL